VSESLVRQPALHQPATAGPVLIEGVADAGGRVGGEFYFPVPPEGGGGPNKSEPPFLPVVVAVGGLQVEAPHVPADKPNVFDDEGLTFWRQRL